MKRRNLLFSLIAMPFSALAAKVAAPGKERQISGHIDEAVSFHEQAKAQAVAAGPPQPPGRKAAFLYALYVKGHIETYRGIRVHLTTGHDDINTIADRIIRTGLGFDEDCKMMNALMVKHGFGESHIVGCSSFFDFRDEQTPKQNEIPITLFIRVLFDKQSRCPETYRGIQIEERSGSESDFERMVIFSGSGFDVDKLALMSFLRVNELCGGCSSSWDDYHQDYKLAYPERFIV